MPDRKLDLLEELQDIARNQWTTCTRPTGSAEDALYQVAVDLGLLRHDHRRSSENYNAYAPLPILFVFVAMHAAMARALPPSDTTCPLCVKDERRKGREEQFPPGRVVYRAGENSTACTLLSHAFERTYDKDALVLAALAEAPRG